MQCIIDKTSSSYADGASEEATWLALHSAGGAIQRALSCDSVISEASVADLDNADDVNNRIGQLEFSVQYLRCVCFVTANQAKKNVGPPCADVY